MRAVLSTIGLIGLLLLAACGQPEAGTASQPTQPAAPTSEPPTAAPQPTLTLVPTSEPPTAAPQPTQPAAPTSEPAPTAPTDVRVTLMAPSATPVPGGADRIVVILHQTGGFIGIDKTLTVYTSGRLTLSGDGGGKETQVAPAEVAPLQKLLASPEFAALQPRYEAAGNDLFTYEITVPDGGRGQTVVTMDGAQNPPVLTQVLAELNKLSARVQ
jgi:hypothetical protein